MSQTSVSVSVLANLLCIDERRVQQLEKEGIIKKSGRGEYSLVASVQGYIRFLQNAQRGGGGQELAKIKLRKEEAKTRLVELEVRQMEGELVPVADVHKAWTDISSHLRAKLLAIPSKMAPELASIGDVNETQSLLKKQITEALRELSSTDAVIEAPPDGRSEDSETGL